MTFGLHSRQPGWGQRAHKP